jgi:hypothetical protein
MSRRRSSSQKTKRAQRGKPVASTPVRATKQHPKRSLWVALGIVLAISLAGVGWWLLGGRAVGNDGNSQPAATTIGGVMDCRGTPEFSERLGYQDRLGISTSERNYAGLVIFDGRLPLTAPLEQRDLHQEPSWDAAGTLGPFVLDREGNIYSAPVPRTAVSDNPPDTQNTIYRVDSVTGEMEPFVTLPDAPPPSPQNPFGILGLTYDCERDALYVSTAAGSTLAEEQGRIVRVDLATGTTTEEVVGVDAIGLGVFRGVDGKRLYFGLARESTLASVALDEAGHAVGEIRTELAVADTAAGLGEPKIRRISFDRDMMTLYIVPFNFNLRAVSEQQQVIARYRYVPETDGWELVRE